MAKLIEIIKKDFKHIIRARASSLILILGPLLVILLSGLLVGGIELHGVKAGMISQFKDEFTAGLTENLQDRNFKVIGYSDVSDCVEDIKKGGVHVCVEVVDRGKPDLERIDPRLNRVVRMHVDYSRMQIVWQIINSVNSAVSEESREVTKKLEERFSELGRMLGEGDEEFGGREAQRGQAIGSKALAGGIDFVQRPIPTEVSAVYGENIKAMGDREPRVFEFLFPSIFLITIMFFSILLTSTLEMKERSTKAYLRNLTTPTRDITFVSGTVITSLIVIALVIVILMLIGKFVLDIGFISGINLLGLSVLLIFVIGFFIVVGLIMGSIFSSAETIIIGSVITSLIFLISSSIITPIEKMPAFVGKVISFTPVALAESAVRKIIIFGLGMSEISTEIYLLATAFLVSLAILLVARYLRREI